MRDYSLTGPEGDIAVENGLAGADWYHSPVERQEFLALMTRTNSTAAWHTALWFVLLGVSAWWLITTWFSWWTLPAAFVYGTLYGSVCDPRWHECGHKTAFSSKRANEIVYHIASFMDLREPISWRWSHLRHHADTIIVGVTSPQELAEIIRVWDQVPAALAPTSLASFDLSLIDPRSWGEIPARLQP